MQHQYIAIRKLAARANSRFALAADRGSKKERPGMKAGALDEDAPVAI
jgi:hypothetical protein